MNLRLLDFNFSLLSSDSNVKTFDCDQEEITSFLQEDALDYQNQKMANTYVFTDCKNIIWAYFTVANGCLNDLGTEKGFTNTVWNRLHRTLRIPNDKRIKQYPAVKLGRLGVHKGLHGTGLSYQIMDFIKKWISIDQKAGCRLLLLDAINQPKQLRFYHRNDFSLLLPSDEDATTRIMYYDLLKHDVLPITDQIQAG